jgi:hypothetical protein
MNKSSLLRVSAALVAACSLFSSMALGFQQSSAASNPKACDNLRIAIETSTAYVGNVSLVVLVANAGATCALKGKPSVSMWSSNGKVIAKSRENINSSSAPVGFTLPHNSVASFKVSWTDEAVGTSVRHDANYLIIRLPKSAQARYSEFDINSVIYGDSLGVTTLRLGVTP